MIAEEKPAGWAGAANSSSVETPDRPEQAGGMVSPQSNNEYGSRRCQKSSQQSPPQQKPMPKGSAG